MLDTLASPGYTLTNRFNKVDVRQLHQLFCKANCFCPIYYKEFTTQNDVPYGGCYRKSTLPAIHSLAQRSCNRHYDGVIATVRTREKMEFLTQYWRYAYVNYCIARKIRSDAIVNQNRKGFPIHMDVFKVIAQIVLSTSFAVVVPCAREKKTTIKPVSAAAEVKVMPAQLRQIMEAEQMAKASKGYDSYDVELDDSDLPK
ncbi:unnamed protein product [Haemonchus placei]|uniref:Late expression factor 11 n=1 Tax=Haemonchus placei TaxID=6290 RepID=A0A0N4X2Y1_HAEPC|nr:unnamed protein product [Haemonchus placei]